MVYSFKITWKTQFVIIAGSYLMTLLLKDTVNSILDNFAMSGIINNPTPSILVNFYIYVILLLIPISIVHEGLHGLAYTIFGGKVKFGFKIIYAYTQEISGANIDISKFIIILLIPLVIISIACMLVPTRFSGMVYLLNLLGSSGDLYMAITLCRYNVNCKIIDKSYGYDVIDLSK